MKILTVSICALAASILPPVAASQAADHAPAAGIAAKSGGPNVTLKVAKKSVDVGKKVSAKVMVTPASKRTVQIQMSSSTNTWQTVTRAKTSASGKVKTSFVATKDGPWKVRAVVGNGRSKVSKVKAGYGVEIPKQKLDPMKPGKLETAKAGVFTAGPYRIEVTKAGKPHMTVTDDAGRIAWASDPGAAFVGASRSSVRWVQRSTAGAFFAQVQRSARLTDQSIKSIQQSGDEVTISGVVSGKSGRAAYTLTMKPEVRSAQVTALSMKVEFAKSNGKGAVKPNSIQLTSGRQSRAGVHGFGNQCQDFDVSGQVLPLLVQEQGITRGQKPAASTIDAATWGAGNLKTVYGGWPTYVTDQMRSFELVDNKASGAFSVADMTRDTQISLESFAKTMTARVVARDNPFDLIKARGAGIARPELADWVQRGAVLGIQGGTAKVRNVVSEMQAAGAKISGVWLQDWVGKRVTSFGEQLWWTWQLDKSTYPDWNQMVADFRAQSIQTTTYVNPFVINQDSVNGTPIRNLYKEAEQKGFLVKNQRGKTYVVQTVGFPTALVDLTNPKARDWFADVIATQVIGVGATGFMADFGEYTPFDSVMENGPALKQHNRWPELWAQTVREACDRGGQPNCMAFFRSSYLGTPKNAPLMWAGDQMVNYAEEDGLASAVKCMLAGGVSGAPLWHSDIGGYTSVNAVVTNFLRPPDLNARWAEMQAFGTVMRTHETNRPKLNQQVYDTPGTRSQFARMTQIYAALYDYRKTVIDEAVADGIPAMRHTWMVYPGTKAAESELQFFLGEHLMMAPVHSENATSVEVTFPPGQWRHVLTGQVYDGDTKAGVDAPVGTPAAFVKVGDPVGDQIMSALAAGGFPPGA